MELKLSTLVLELVNFLVLVWLLKRLLYRPVLEVIARRRSAIEQTLADARTIEAHATELKAQYEHRLEAWEQERQVARETLRHDLAAEREQLRAKLREQLEQERAKAEVLAQRRLDELRRRDEQHAVHLGARFAAKLLEPLACAEVEARLTELALRELTALPEARLAELRQALNNGAEAIVTSAFPLTAPRSDTVRNTLAQALRIDAKQVRFELDAALLAGLRVTAGPWCLTANLQDELTGFAELADASAMS